MNDEATAVAEFLKQKSVVRCPPAYVAATTAALPPSEEARRLARLKLSPWLTARELAHAERGRRARRR